LKKNLIPKSMARIMETKEKERIVIVVLTVMEIVIPF